MTKNHKILIIDDEKDIVTMLKDSFELEGYQVFIAMDGVEGVIKTKRHQPDAIILDIMMPDLNGFDTLKILREEYDIPIILLSAKYRDEDKVYGFGIGADDYVVKPFSIKELKARVAAHIRRYHENGNKRLSASSAPALKIDDLEIHFQKSKVYYKNEEIPLTNKEFEIVKLLSMHPGQTFTRENIYELVWEDNAYFDNQTITEHIKRIRSKLHAAGSPDYIQTIWGVGYKWSGWGRDCGILLIIDFNVFFELSLMGETIWAKFLNCVAHK